ncbi:putative spermidine/putrescine transport system ATP-binding protein [Sinorhizobium kostiense]|uniref:Spermidine/putrescine import ATP-binding protein PotA n=1 Tax=Sinorhizobium kostiense TaxID=76747 RepID=A0ABS4QUP3_9HYPH|nr:ABC transporter ATP-binding protein [Sinorhizobium kostiense]MBP2234363.1 putative spermidine/putrescine transport system ATP-binding protein [Sinorhizobium kostiense]
MTERFIAFEGVRKSYDGKSYVVRGLDLDVARGEFLTLLGPSGSGKTTTLMMLAGFETPTHGSITLGGGRIERVPPHRRNIGVVFQNYALFPHMTVGENLAFPLKMRRMSKADVTQCVRHALDMVRMSSFEGRRPNQLSGGQQQRIALARALVFEPQLVLMDEPLGALDKQLREHMQLEIKHLHNRLGINVVYVTHDQSEALTMSDRVGVFNDGTLQQIASPHDLYEAPANPFVATFIGENNAIAGEVVELSNGTCRIKASDGSLISAIPGGGLKIGARTTLVLRPERISLAEDLAGANRFTAHVNELIYHGDHMRLRVTVCGCDDVRIKIPAGAGRTPQPGAHIDIGWAREDCRALAQS